VFKSIEDKKNPTTSYLKKKKKTENEARIDILRILEKNIPLQQI
jgi:hypothetical protein